VPPCLGFPISSCLHESAAGSLLSTNAIAPYARAIRALRRFTQASLNQEPHGDRRSHGPLISAKTEFVECLTQRDGASLHSPMIGLAEGRESLNSAAGAFVSEDPSLQQFAPRKNRRGA